MFVPVLAGLRIRRRGRRRPQRRPDRVRGDKAYSSRDNRAYLRRRGIKATIAQPDDQRAAASAGSGRRPSPGLRQGSIPPPKRGRTVRQQVEAVPRGGQQVRQTRLHLQRHPDRRRDRHLAPRHRPRAIRNGLTPAPRPQPLPSPATSATRPNGKPDRALHLPSSDRERKRIKITFGRGSNMRTPKPGRHWLPRQP